MLFFKNNRARFEAHLLFNLYLIHLPYKPFSQMVRLHGSHFISVANVKGQVVKLVLINIGHLQSCQHITDGLPKQIESLFRNCKQKKARVEIACRKVVRERFA
jgi:hypothetical protein